MIAARAEESHFYVAMDGETIIGCGGITGYWGSTEESYLISIFVLPDYQGKGVGRKMLFIPACVLVAVAIVFVIYVLGHPELSFPWSTQFTHILYGLYVVTAVLLFVLAFWKKRD